MPPIKPVITRVHVHSGVFPCCQVAFTVTAPEGMEPGSPFGPGIQALLIHLHVTQAISFERLKEIMRTVFGFDISQGAIANILQRALKPMLAAAEEIGEEVRRAQVIASDETSARVCGRKHWQWVIHTTTAVYHVIADTRAAQVITDFLAWARPKVWVADRYGAQNGHGEQRQVCLAHLLRDAQHAIDSGDTAFAPGFKALLKRACNIGKRRDRLKDKTLDQYLAQYLAWIKRILPTPSAFARAWPLRKTGAATSMAMISVFGKASASGTVLCPTVTPTLNIRRGTPPGRCSLIHLTRACPPPSDKAPMPPAVVAKIAQS